MLFDTIVLWSNTYCTATRRPKGRGWCYEAHLRGLGMCNMYLTTILFDTIQARYHQRCDELSRRLVAGEFDAEPQSGRSSARFD